MQRHEEALASFRRAIALRPDFAEAHNSLGGALNDLGRHREAIESCEQALALRPHFAEAYGNLGLILTALNRHDEAIASCRKALSINPDLAEAHCNLGCALNDLGHQKEAIASYEQARALDPELAEAHWNLALALLATGDFARGWQEHEWRWRANVIGPEQNFRQPLWLGVEDLTGKTILLHNEQGLGDALQFVRYAPQVRQRGARVVLRVQRPLLSLMAGLAGVDLVIAEGDALPEFDFHCPLLSLPLAFGTHLQNIPAGIPYLHPAADRLAKWQSILGERTAPRIGLAWSGNPAHKNDRNRSIALKQLLPLLSVPGVRFVSLQRDLREDDAAVLGNLPALVSIGAQLDDFADTAAAISLLDLVITVDTAVAHLAGALGKPVWVLLPFAPDWRWLLKREDSPWYPTARLFRQQQINDWDEAVSAVAIAMQMLIQQTMD